MSSLSKQRTTCTIASTFRILPKNLLPKPSPFDAPFTKPAMSTYSMNSCVTFCELHIFERSVRRLSGTFALPWFGSMVQKGKLAASATPVSHSALNRVLFPTFGSPTMPVFKPRIKIFACLVDCLFPPAALLEATAAPAPMTAAPARVDNSAPVDAEPGARAVELLALSGTGSEADGPVADCAVLETPLQYREPCEMPRISCIDTKPCSAASSPEPATTAAAGSLDVKHRLRDEGMLHCGKGALCRHSWLLRLRCLVNEIIFA
mmetsp:Transcript_44425/g.105243  ORF Transcript_44425/g.105243 Transcript_44425/m.105243 type:complete len:263 (+) Transcript_44425:883-1671(+)